jgi:hypothetical protein
MLRIILIPIKYIYVVARRGKKKIGYFSKTELNVLLLIQQMYVAYILI